jgi:hypothetical protein
MPLQDKKIPPMSVSTSGGFLCLQGRFSEEFVNLIVRAYKSHQIKGSKSVFPSLQRQDTKNRDHCQCKSLLRIIFHRSPHP